MPKYFFRAAYSAIASLRRSLQIFIYHRVLADPDPLFPDIVHAVQFKEQVSWIKSCFAVLPLTEAIDALYSDTLPSRSACVTFDDGYADNSEVALPILRAFGVTATFFIASNFLNGGRMWNDSVIEAVRRYAGDRMDLEGLGLGRHSVANPLERRAAIDALLERLKYFPLNERSSRVDDLVSTLAVELPQDLMMTTVQVQNLQSAGMEIGGHTGRHPILAKLDRAEARREIADGKACLEGIIGAPVTLFAYPNGKPTRDYLPEHVQMVRELGFKAAVSTAIGVATRASDRYQLPRFTPWDLNMNMFGMRLAQNQLRMTSAVV